MSVRGYLVYVPFENVASMEYGNNGAPDKATIATTPGHLAGPFEVREVEGHSPPDPPDWEGDRAQAVEVAGAELGLMISGWHYRKRPEVTMTELAGMLAREVCSALKYAVRAERVGQEEDDDDE